MLPALINGFVASVPVVAIIWLLLAVSRRWVNAATRYAIWWILLAVVVYLPFRYIPSRPLPQYTGIAVTTAALSAAVIAQRPSVSSGAPPSSRPLRAERWWFPLRIAPGRWSSWILAVWTIAALVVLLRLFVSYAFL